VRDSPFSPKAEAEMERRFKLEKRAIELLDIIVAEFESDPMSVQCFDLRIVEEAKQVNREIRKLRPSWEIFG